MITRAMLLLLTATALLSACDNSSTPSNTSADGNTSNGGLSVQAGLTQDDLNLIANLDHQSYLLAFNTNPSANVTGTLSSMFQNTADLQSAFSVVTNSCMTTNGSSYILACGSGSTTVDGSYGLVQQKIAIKLNVKTANSSAVISHEYDFPVFLNGSGGTLASTIDDSLDLNGMKYVIQGQPQINLGPTVAPTPQGVPTLSASFAYSGSLIVARDGNPPVTVSVSSTSAKIVYSIGGSSVLCGGSIRYLTPNGLETSFALAACPQSSLSTGVL